MTNRHFKRITAKRNDPFCCADFMRNNESVLWEMCLLGEDILKEIDICDNEIATTCLPSENKISNNEIKAIGKINKVSKKQHISTLIKKRRNPNCIQMKKKITKMLLLMTHGEMPHISQLGKEKHNKNNEQLEFMDYEETENILNEAEQLLFGRFQNILNPMMFNPQIQWGFGSNVPLIRT